jgi:hypothetical protein
MSTTTNTTAFNSTFDFRFEGIVYMFTVWGKAEIEYEGDDIDEPMFRKNARLVEIEVEEYGDADGGCVGEDVYDAAYKWIENNFEDFI